MAEKLVLNTGRWSVAILVTVVLILAGCGGTASPGQGGAGSTTPTTPAAAATPGTVSDATPGTSLTACELVLGSDLDTALGLDAGTASDGEPRELAPGDDPAATSCRWSISDWGGLSVNVIPTTGAAHYATTVDSVGDRGEALDIGDGSIWVDDIERGYFSKGSVLILIQFLTLYVDTTPRDATISLGTAAIDRL